MSRILEAALNAIKRDVFLSYHHADRRAKELFVSEFSSVFTDRSLGEPVDSDQPDYVHRAIREANITGTSATIVLCGNETWKRKFVDWEIHSTPLKRHGLIGIVVPGTIPIAVNTYRVPDRFSDDLMTGYAQLYHWPATTTELRGNLEDSIARATHIEPVNSRSQLAYNQS